MSCHKEKIDIGITYVTQCIYVHQNIMLPHKDELILYVR